MNETITHQILDQNPKLQGIKDKIASIHLGSYCLHPTWGMGQIMDYDARENRLVIDFEGQRKGHRMDPSFCLDKLEILPADHLIVLQVQEPESIEKKIKQDPVGLVIQALAHFPHQTASSSELERLLSKVVGVNRFKKWWLSTKKLVAQDARISSPTRKTDPYILRDIPIQPEVEILEHFFDIKHPREKIAIAEKLLNLSNSVAEIAEELPRVLEDLTAAIQQAKQLSDAERLQGIWVRNDLARHLDLDVDQLEPTSSSILMQAEDRYLDIVNELSSNQYKRFLDLLMRVHPGDGLNIIFNLLRLSTGKFTPECIQFLMDAGQEEALGTILNKWLNEQSLKSPLIAWIFKNRQTRKFSKLLSPLITHRLLAAALYSIDYEALQLNTNRRIALAEQLSDDTQLINDLLEQASVETAHDLAHALIISQGFENLTKKSLLARFIKRFPSIQSILSNEAQQETERLIVSKESLEARKKEYELLINQKIPENKQAIATAREHGDLKENSEYKMARQDQELLMAKKALLESELARASVTDFKDASPEKVGIGCLVDLIEMNPTGEAAGRIQTFAILGAWDSDPEKNILSYQTPLAKSLIGKYKGDKVETTVGQHQQHWSIQSIRRWIDR